MEKIRKKTKKRRLNKVVLLAVLLIIAAALLFALQLLRENTSVPAPDPSSISTQVRLFECESSQVNRIQITPPEGERYTLVYHNGTLVLPDDDQYPIRDSLVSSILSNVSHIIAEEIILDTTKTIVNLADFGLDDPQCTVKVTYKDGTVNTLQVGDQIRAGIPYYYFMWNEDPVIYSVSTDVYDAFSSPFSALHTIMQPAWDSTLWDRIEITGENTRTLQRTDFGWQITSPCVYPLDSETTNNFLTNLENIRFSQYVGKADELDLNKYGLDTPRLTLTIHQAASSVSYLDSKGSELGSVQLPEEDIVLRCGSAIDDYFFYVEYLGTVCTATRFQLGILWDTDHSALFESYPANIDITQLKRLTITQGKTTSVYEIRLTEQLKQNGDVKTDVEGNVLYDVIVHQNGAPIDSESFLLWYAQLRQLTGESTLPAGSSSDSSAEIQFTFEGENSRRTLTFHVLDSVYYMLFVDGTAHVYFPQTAVKALLALPE